MEFLSGMLETVTSRLEELKEIGQEKPGLFTDKLFCKTYKINVAIHQVLTRRLTLIDASDYYESNIRY